MDYPEYIKKQKGNYALPFPHPGGWALDPEASKFLGSLVRDMRPHNCLEFGSGYSSCIISYELERAGHGELDSIDHSILWSKKAAEMASTFGVSSRIRFHSLPLIMKYKHYPSIFYDIKKNNDLKPVYDLVLVDGPPHTIGRDGALFEIYDCLRVGGYIIADDARSGHMGSTLSRWRKIFPGSISIRVFPEIGKGIALIRKKALCSNEPLFILHQYIVFWMKAVRNYFRLYDMEKQLE